MAGSSEEYEVGYVDGEHSMATDYALALDLFCDVPEDVDVRSPTELAAWVKSLQKKVTGMKGIIMPDRNFYRSDLRLGERYRDKGTGIEGNLIAVAFFEYACERGTLRYINGQQDVVEASFDAPELVHVESGKPATSSRPGGPVRTTGARGLR